jgi:N-acetylmuramoyl-L-alanine amidase
MVKTPNYFLRFSPNHNARPYDPVSLIVLHYTGMQSGAEALEWLCNPESKVSAHYLVEEDGAIFQLVEEDRRAWHAGVGYWQGVRNINDISIGIEMVNRGHAWGYTPFPEIQVQAVMGLCHDIMARHELPAQNVIGHSDIAPTRKQDPGELFPWEKCAKEGIGIWHDVAAGSIPPAPQPITAQELDALAQIGYEIIEDDPTHLHAVITAFQRHFRPHLLNGKWDTECSAIILNLADKKKRSETTF